MFIEFFLTSVQGIIALMRDDVTISLVTSKRGLVVMLSREY